jgi:TonB family protein
MGGVPVQPVMCLGIETMSKNFAVTPLATGARLDSYVIERVVSHSPSGFTYLAEDASQHVCVIREFLPQEFAERGADGTVRPRDADDRNSLRFWLRAFLERATQLARLSHSGVPVLLRQFEANGTGYVVSAYTPGQTLRSLLEQVGTLAENPLRRILHGVLGALDAAHAAGFQHRDLRLEHIWVRDQDAGIELLNFGVLRGAVRMKARLVTSEATAPYAAPEEAIANSVFGPSTDLYSVGAIAYWVLSGAPPLSAAARSQGGSLKPTAEATRVRCSDSFARAIDWALRLDPALRPQTVAVWRDALGGGVTVDVPPLVEAAPGTRPSKRRFGLLAGVAVLALAAVYGLIPRRAAPPQAAPNASVPAAAAVADGAQPEDAAAAPAGEASALDRLALDFISRDKKAQETQKQKALADKAAQDAARQLAATKPAAAAPAPAPTVVAAAPARTPAAPPPAVASPSTAVAQTLALAPAPVVASKPLEAPPTSPSPAPAVQAPPPPTPAPVAAAPPASPALAVDAQNLSAAKMRSYLAAINSYLNTLKRYPTGREASLQHPSGTARVTFVLARDGKLLSAEIEATSNSILLDRQALTTVRRGSYPPFPSEAFPGESSHRFSIDLGFAPNH